ncbi:MAG: hypothetical protein Kow0077_19520 [Anaerolineae bacterium]
MGKPQPSPGKHLPTPAIELPPHLIARALLTVVLTFGVLSLAGLVTAHRLATPLGLTLGERSDPTSLYSLLYIFNPADRMSLGRWLFTGLLTLAAMPLGVAGLRNTAYRGQWIGLAGLSAGLSAIKITALDTRLADTLATISTETPYGWWSLLAVLAAVLMPSFASFMRALPRHMRWRLAGALAVVLGGAPLARWLAVVAGNSPLRTDLLTWGGGMLELVGAVALIHTALISLTQPAIPYSVSSRLLSKRFVRYGWVVLGLWLAFAILLHAAGTRYLRPDEMHSFEATEGSLFTTVSAIASDVHSPAYFVAFHLWRQFVGTGEYSARLFSVLLSMLTLSVTYRLGQDWLEGKEAGLLALLALGVSAYFYRYSVEIRPYPLLMLTAAGSMLLGARWLTTPTRWRAALYGLSVASVMYTHYLGAFLILMQAIYWLMMQGRRLTGRLLLQAGLAWGSALILWLPWLPVFVMQTRREGTLVTTGLIPGLGKAGSALPTNPTTIRAFLFLTTNGLPLVAGLVVLAGLWCMWKMRPFPAGRHPGLAVLWALGIPVLVFAVNVIVPIYEPRYIAYVAVGVAILLAAGVLAFPPRIRTATATALLLIGLITVRSGTAKQDPLRDTLGALESAFQPGDVVLLVNQSVDHSLAAQYEWYAPSARHALYVLGENARAYPPFQKWEESLNDLPRCVWFGTNNWFDEAVRNWFNILERRRALLVTVGNHTETFFQRLCLAPEGTAQVFGTIEGDHLNFLGMDIIAQSRDSLTLALWWEVDASLKVDYSIGAYLLDRSGMLIAQKDGPITDYWNGATILTTALEPGQRIIDRRTISLPPNLPLDEYTLALAVYHPEDGTRLPVAGTSDHLLRLQTIALQR